LNRSLNLVEWLG
jgi:6-pyruvoyltetrahydropterin/6-carboxytetrahydropterin synthase